MCYVMILHEHIIILFYSGKQVLFVKKVFLVTGVLRYMTHSSAIHGTLNVNQCKDISCH